MQAQAVEDVLEWLHGLLVDDLKAAAALLSSVVVGAVAMGGYRLLSYFAYEGVDCYTPPQGGGLFLVG